MRDLGVVAFGFEQGKCNCFNGGDPALGCAKVCVGEQKIAVTMLILHFLLSLQIVVTMLMYMT